MSMYHATFETHTEIQINCLFEIQIQLDALYFYLLCLVILRTLENSHSTVTVL